MEIIQSNFQIPNKTYPYIPTKQRFKSAIEVKEIVSGITVVYLRVEVNKRVDVTGFVKSVGQYKPENSQSPDFTLMTKTNDAMQIDFDEFHNGKDYSFL